ncbi:hypothetical protein CHS0354_020416 [Potamilus streckersoni]|uniref:Uncharacterized protein n=1 Tax=Potamilus streckersoni TaxID=2493646 RepID=A0AAE0SW71_9BIVA|nr:hypothetical protein CHS0354_020416 [Potamilus streckersoni]
MTEQGRNKAIKSQIAMVWGFPTVFTGIRIITVTEKDSKKIPAFFYVLGSKEGSSNRQDFKTSVPISPRATGETDFRIFKPGDEHFVLEEPNFDSTQESSDGNNTFQETLSPGSPTNTET